MDSHLMSCMIDKDFAFLWIVALIGKYLGLLKCRLSFKMSLEPEAGAAFVVVVTIIVVHGHRVIVSVIGVIIGAYSNSVSRLQ